MDRSRGKLLDILKNRTETNPKKIANFNGQEHLRGTYCVLPSMNREIMDIFNGDREKTRKHIRVTPEALNLFCSKLDNTKVHGWNGKFEISNALCELMNNCEIAQIVHWTLTAIVSSEDKRLTVTENILKDLQVRNLATTRRTAILSEISLDIVKYSPRELVTLINFCVDAITQDKDEHKSWKELLPKLLSAVVEKDEVLVSGTPKTGEEYKIDVIHTLCMGNWESKSLAAIASMFVDVPMKTEEHLQVVNKLCSAIPDLVTNELPPLVHELLRLCKNGHSIIMFSYLQEYFNDLLYNNRANDPSNSFEDISDDTRRSTRAQPVESTVLLYINQSANMGDASIKDLIKSIRKLKSAPEKLLEPFLLTVLLSVTNVSAFKEPVLDVLRQTFVTIVTEGEKRSKSAWIRSNTPGESDTNQVIDAVIRSSIPERESVTKGLISLAFGLLSIPVSTKVREPMAERLWRHGNHIVVTLLRKQGGDELSTIVLNHISISIRLRQAIRQHIACLQAISTHSRLSIMQNDAIVISLMEHFVYMEENTGLALVKALLPGIRYYQHLKDTLIVILRKALYSSSVETRVAAATSFLHLLKHCKVNSMGILSQNSQASSSTSRSTQSVYASERPRVATVSSNSICLEILGVLRRCLTQQAEVRQALYETLSNSVSENPELLSYVEDVLVNHLTIFFVENEAVLPPLDFNKVAVIKDVGIVVKEPLPHLVFVCQQVISQDPSRKLSRCGVNLQEMLDSLTDRMTKCTLEELKLTDATELLDVLPENCHKQEMVKQMLGVYEALMAYVLASWTVDTPGHGRKLVGLFKSYTRLVEFCKSTTKAKKSDLNETGVKRTKSVKSQNETKKKGAPGKPLTFKFPPNLWDYPTILKMLELIYEDSVEWCSEDVANQTKSHRELCRYAIQTASQLVKLRQFKKRFHDVPGAYVKLTSLLYRNVICKLVDEIEYDPSVAITAVECFTDLMTLVGVLPKQQEDFMAKVVNSKDRPLIKIITTYEQLLAHVLGQDEDKDEPSSKKLPQLLVSGLSLLVSLLPANTPDSDLTEIYDWVKEFATDTDVANDLAANGILELLLNLHIRCKTSGTVFDGVALQLCSIIGTHQDEVNKPFTKLAIVTKTRRHTAMLSLCSALADVLTQVQWMVARFHSEFAALQHPGKQTLDERRKALKEKERSLCLHLSYTINVVIYLCYIDLQAMTSALLAVLRLLTTLYVNITSVTRYFLVRSTKLQPAFQAAKFENLVKLCGKELSTSVNDFIVHIENCSTEDRGNKKEVDPLVLKMRVLREEKIIPKVTFEKEQFEKWLIKLGNKTKIDLMQHVKVAGARDFRIKRSKLKSGLENQTAMDTTEDEVEEGHNQSEEEDINDEEEEEEANGQSDEQEADGQSSEDEATERTKPEPKRKKLRTK